MLTRSRTASVQRVLLIAHLSGSRRLGATLALGFTLLLWPWRSAVTAWRLTGRVGHQLAETRSRPVQFLQQLWLAWLHGISPFNYYLLGMGSTRTLSDPMAWLQNGQAGLLLRAFRDRHSTPEIGDKRLFCALMEAQGIPTPEILAVIESGLTMSDEAKRQVLATLPRWSSFFVKPLSSFGGKDCLVLERMDDQSWQPVLAPATSERYLPLLENAPGVGYHDLEVLDLITTCAALGPLIIQRRLENHPGIPTFGGKGLAVVRVISGIGEMGPVILRAVLCIPFIDSIISQRGIDVAVDEQTGMLGLAQFDGIDQRRFRSLGPDGPEVQGIQLPFWSEALDWVRRAHLTLFDYPFLGWDVALTPDGPVIIEANGNFGTVGSQKPGPRPMIDEQFLAVFDHQMMRRRSASSS